MNFGDCQTYIIPFCTQGLCRIDCCHCATVIIQHFRNDENALSGTASFSHIQLQNTAHLSCIELRIGSDSFSWNIEAQQLFQHFVGEYAHDYNLVMRQANPVFWPVDLPTVQNSCPMIVEEANHFILPEFCPKLLLPILIKLSRSKNQYLQIILPPFQQHIIRNFLFSLSANLFQCIHLFRRGQRICKIKERTYPRIHV